MRLIVAIFYYFAGCIFACAYALTVFIVYALAYTGIIKLIDKIKSKN